MRYEHRETGLDEEERAGPEPECVRKYDADVTDL